MACTGNPDGYLVAAMQAADRRIDSLATEVQRLERDGTQQATQHAAQDTEMAELRALLETLARQLAQQR